MSGQWSSGLFSCFDDCGSCLLTACFPYIQFGLNAAELEGGSCVGPCAGYCLCMACCSMCGGYAFYHGPKRRLLREQAGNLPEVPMNDCCTTFWCSYCSICQEHRELKNKAAWSKAVGAPTTSTLPPHAQSMTAINANGKTM